MVSYSYDMVASLDGIATIRKYIDRIVQGDHKCTGMKVLLLDVSTTQIVSSVYSQTEILNQQVYLVSRIDTNNNNSDDKKTRLNKHNNKQSKSSSSNNGYNENSSNNDGYNNLSSHLHHDDSEHMMGDVSMSSIPSNQSHLKAVCFIRPTQHMVHLLGNELQKPRFAEYHIFFSGILSSGLLRLLAENDIDSRVRQVQEFYADFCPITPTLLTLQSRHTLPMTVAAGTSWAPKYAHQYERNLNGLQSMLLAFKRQPTVIRYAGHSPCAEELAKDIHDAIQQDDIFHFRRVSNTGTSTSGGFMLLVLDRRDDPVTPLLSQWTYQAMVHELLGLNNHRVVLRGAPNISKELEEVVLSTTQDDFFRDNCHKNFGELGDEIQHLLRDYQKQSAQHNPGNLNSIDEIQQFMEKVPELRSRSHNVSKHVAIMGELARLVEVCSLMDVSQFEQELACADDQNTHWRELMDKLSANSPIKIPDKLRLGLLFALRYETTCNIHMLQSAMTKGGVPPDMVNLIGIMLRYGGTKSRGPGLYGDMNNNIVSKMTKSFMSSVQGVENVYARHVPCLIDTIQSIAKGKLSHKTHPVVPGSYRRTGPMSASADSSSSPLSAAGGTQSIISTSGGGGGTASSTTISGGTSAGGSSSISASSSSTLDPASHHIPEEVLIFVVGGVTYEEATKVDEFNRRSAATSGHHNRMQVVLAGSTVHNSTSFLDELRATAL